MNQFTKTTIVNSFDPKDFKKLLGINPEYVVEAYRHDGRWGRKEVVTVDLAQVYPTGTTPVKTPDVVRLEVRLHTVGAHLGEFQNALTRNSELFTYEAKYGSAADMAAGFVKAAKNHRNTSKNFDFEVTDNGAGLLTFTAGADYIRFKEIFVNEVASNYTGYEAQENKVVFTGEDIVDNTVTPAVTIVDVTPGMNGFGDTAWLINNFKLPTYVNTNWMALHQDERPVPGKLYNQFTLHAVADRGELTGMGAVGQKMASKTTHVFYVAADLSVAFETAITAMCTKMTLPLGATASTEAANSKVAVIGEATMGADADADGTIDYMTYVVGGTTETIANPEEE
jgi:hypothetical protein